MWCWRPIHSISSLILIALVLAQARPTVCRGLCAWLELHFWLEQRERLLLWSDADISRNRRLIWKDRCCLDLPCWPRSLFFSTLGSSQWSLILSKTTTFFFTSYFDNAVNDSTRLNMRGCKKMINKLKYRDCFDTQPWDSFNSMSTETGSNRGRDC